MTAPATVDTSAPAVLDRAATYLTLGKAHGHYRDDDPTSLTYCCYDVTGAIRAALRRDPTESIHTADPMYRPYVAAHDLLCQWLYDRYQIGEPRRGLPGWSDGHTASHVIAEMRACARGARDPMRRRRTDPPASAASPLADTAATDEPATPLAPVAAPGIPACANLPGRGSPMGYAIDGRDGGDT